MASDRQPGSMAPLLAMALKYQRVLDDVTELNWLSASAVALSMHKRAKQAGVVPNQGLAGFKPLEQIILQTTLAASMVKYLEGIPWASITLQMVKQTEGTPLSQLETCNTYLA